MESLLKVAQRAQLRPKKPPQKVLESADTWKSRVAVDTASFNIYEGRLGGGVKVAFGCILMK